jgi:ATP-dependent DNA helicase UvrD/PcrA
MAEPKRNDPVLVHQQPAAGGIAARALGQRAALYLADLNPEQRAAVETLDGGCWFWPARESEGRGR